MTPSEEIQAKLKCNDLTGALAACKAAIRKAPTDGELRFMLFQLLSLLADWEGASNQLVAYSELVGRQSPLPIIFNEVIQAEVRRKYIFQGEEPPTIFGEPPEWVPYLLQALTASARQQPDDAAALRQKALEEAPAVSGSIDGQPFSWIMDGDSRISLLVEAIIHGQYYWVPQSRLRAIRMEPPTQARDAIWAAATLILDNSSEISAFIPVRYPGAQSWTSEALKLARETAWESPVENFYLGSGQRVWMTDIGEHALLDTREIIFNPPA
jgi:type VI secretion system protein ImpE